MSNKALIIGAGGFVGGYLIDCLCKSGQSVCATKLEKEQVDTDNAKIVNLDILDYDAVYNLINEYKPSYIYHLAAQSSVSYAWKDPKTTVDININGTLNVLNAVKELAPKTKILLIGSSEQYGGCNSKNGVISEEHALSPNNIYAMTKVAQEITGKVYAKAYDMNIVMVRAFNHIGPKQAPIFVVSDFCKQVAEIEKGLKEPVMKVGNLSAKRDFTDVRDIVSAYVQIIDKGQSGEIYNVGSAVAIEINEILKLITSNATCDIKVEIDSAKLRPVDTPVVKADTSKLQKAISWQPQYKIEDTVIDVLNYWRKNV